jgi:Domain of unknown function (DUF1906)
MLPGHVFTADDALKGFDVNTTVSAGAAAAFAGAGYRFCIRYVRRQKAHTYDLSAKEAKRLLSAGLGLMVVQHVAPGEWTPTAAKGTQYGNVAAEEATRIGFPSGTTVWCDLESVASDTPRKQAIDYCNRWHAAVAAAGFVPGLYVGFAAGLGPKDLYYALRFTHYWGAYNLDADKAPLVRGLQMKQRVRGAGDTVPGFDLAFQPDSVRTDALGGRPTLLAPESWFG